MHKFDSCTAHKEIIMDGYYIYKQSEDYLFGWNWLRHDFKKGFGYPSEEAAFAAARLDKDGAAKEYVLSYHRIVG